jgi:spore coat polysaccharide biosynthesis protein SpsF
MIVAVLQARLSSSRLPGKVLKPILGEPMLLRQIERVSRCNRLDALVVATSDHAADDAIETLCRSSRVACFRGSLDDVLARLHAAASAQHARHVVRLTADCPLADPRVIDDVIALHLETGADYTSNVLPPTYPDGLDVEVMRAEVLSEAAREARLPSEREHVTYFIQERPGRYKLRNLARPDDLSALRWTVDEPRDLSFVEAVYARLYRGNACFSTEDILQLLDREPQLRDVNSGIQRNEGMSESLRADRDFLKRAND